MTDHNRLFSLRFSLAGKRATVTAWEGPMQGHHTRVDVEVKYDGAVIFPRGFTYVGIPGHASLDGIFARKCVLSLVGMKPGDTDREFFDSYSEAQLAFVKAHGEEISMVREMRYCDPDTGNLKN
ncbi:hypothetical protein UFOVP75_12 [uncultured Caudovirales phage]|uniref:Uncharacterized protein n=1 Tax=uncultured Caudovirales phage TaxID=2100421 RepID=A0A6J5KX17_9CAUD|nr:hypothetical protein UFOVP75_12 [uncultured Caudovirales phage]